MQWDRRRNRLKRGREGDVKDEMQKEMGNSKEVGDGN
jgi:hypothetical protein